MSELSITYPVRGSLPPGWITGNAGGFTLISPITMSCDKFCPKSLIEVFILNSLPPIPRNTLPSVLALSVLAVLILSRILVIVDLFF